MMPTRGFFGLFRWWWLALVLGGCWRSPTAPVSSPPPASAPSRPPSTTPRAIDPIIELSTHFFHTCGRRKNGSVLCWGKNTYGQLGDGRRTDSARLVRVTDLHDAAQVAVGRDFSCARRHAGSVVCWGNNEDGQLGDGQGPRPGALSLRPVTVTGLRAVQQISVGEYHACALEQGGAVKCWGNAADGQLGLDSQRAFGMPQMIERLGSVTQISVGSSHSCAVDSRGIVQCWGRNTEGQLGDGRSGSRIKPVMVNGLEDVVELASGHQHTCARRRNGTVACWGSNAHAQLGPNAGRDAKRRVPVAMPGLTTVAALDGGGQHSCARLQTGRVVCWGSNSHGQLGDQRSLGQRATPTPVRGVADAIDLALGAEHTCAARATGNVSCWGSPRHGALGPYGLTEALGRP